MKAVPNERIGVAPDGVIHGVIDVRTGDQGKEGHQKIRGGRVFPNPGHNLRIDGKRSRRKKERGEVRHPQIAEQPV